MRLFGGVMHSMRAPGGAGLVIHSARIFLYVGKIRIALRGLVCSDNDLFLILFEHQAGTVMYVSPCRKNTETGIDQGRSI